MNSNYYVYILTSRKNTVLYTGVTNDLQRRIYEHRHKMVAGFTKRYNVHKLVYYEVLISIDDAITREKQIKKMSREKKVFLIEGFNKGWKDLYEELF